MHEGGPEAGYFWTKPGQVAEVFRFLLAERAVGVIFYSNFALEIIGCYSPTQKFKLKLYEPVACSAFGGQ